MAHHPLMDQKGFAGNAYAWNAPAAPSTAPLSGRARADIAIIGGGITGLSAALHAAERGASVVVLEANEIGWGASGRSFGQVVPYLRHDGEHALASFGAEQGERLVMAAGRGPDLVFGLIQRLGISCEINTQGLLIAAHTPAAAIKLQKRVAFWRDRMPGAEWLDADRIARAVGGGTYWGGILERRGGTINPLAYTRGLAAAGIAAGVRIHTGSIALRLDRRASGWEAHTAGGLVAADTVVLCTNAYTDGLWPGLAREIIPVRGYQLVSRPLREDVWKRILPGGQSLTDTRRLMSGLRKIDGLRLQTSGGVGLFGPHRAPLPARATRRVATLFPELADIEWETGWSGHIAMTVDEYPRIHELAPGLLAGLGCSGRGLALCSVMGRDLAALAFGQRRGLCLPPTPLAPFRMATATKLAVSALAAVYSVRDRFDAAIWGKGPVDRTPIQPPTLLQ